MKNRIWKQIKSKGVVAVAAGTILAAGLSPQYAAGNVMEISETSVIHQQASWTDPENGRAVLEIRIEGLDKWKAQKRFSEGGDVEEAKTSENGAEEILAEEKASEEPAELEQVGWNGEPETLEKTERNEGESDLQDENPALESESGNENGALESEHGDEAGASEAGMSEMLQEDSSLENNRMQGPEDAETVEEREDAYEYMEELAPGEAVQPEDEKPSQEGESTQEGTETGVELVTYISEYFTPELSGLKNISSQQIPVQAQSGERTEITKLECEIPDGEGESGGIRFEIPLVLREEYRYPAEDLNCPVVQDEPLRKDRNGAGTFLLTEENGDRIMVAQGTSPVLKVQAAAADLSLSLVSETKEMKAGKTIRYRVDLANTGKLDLTDIQLTSSFSCPKIAQQWEKAEGLTVNNEKARLDLLKAGESRSFFVLAPLMNQQEKDLEHQVEAEALVKGRTEEVLRRTARETDPLKALKADFTVKKTADRENAAPGDTVTYQICIVNTGEKTLHSVVGTERFQAEGIRAQFVEQEGVTLNRTRTKALISEIAPGEAVSLKAEVKIPEKTVDQKLFNQVTVTAKETGERTVEASSQVTVKGNATERQEGKEITEGIKQEETSEQEGLAARISSNPKTGDDTRADLMVLLGVAAAVTALGCFWLYKKYQDIYS